MQGYAYILTHPGTPCIFLDHLWTDGLLKPSLWRRLRSLLQVHNTLMRLACIAPVRLPGEAEPARYAFESAVSKAPELIVPQKSRPSHEWLGSHPALPVSVVGLQALRGGAPLSPEGMLDLCSTMLTGA